MEETPRLTASVELNQRLMRLNHLQTNSTTRQNQVQDFQSPLQFPTLTLSSLYTHKHTHCHPAKTAKEATSGVIYLLMFFPLRHNGNGRIKEVVNNSRRKEWTH